MIESVLYCLFDVFEIMWKSSHTKSYGHFKNLDGHAIQVIEI